LFNDTVRVTRSTERSRHHDRIFRGALEVAAKCGFAARKQLRHAERLDDVIVRAGLEQPDLLVLVCDDRQNDDRDIRPRADPLEHLGAVEVWQVQVEDDEVRRAEGRGLQAVGCVFRLDHRVALQFEAGAKEAPYLRFVLDQEHIVRGSIHWMRPSFRIASSLSRAG